MTDSQRARLWSHAFGSRLLDSAYRQTLFAALPAQVLLVTFEWLFPATQTQAPGNALGRFTLATLQAHAGQREAARAGFDGLVRELAAEGQSGRLLDQSKAALAVLKKVPA